MLRAGFNVLLIAVFWVGFAGAALADRGKGETTARQGVVKCGGNNFLRLGGTEIQFASYTLRNFDATQPIVVDRMRFFDANGNVLFDTAGGALPLAENGVLGPANSTLNPNQTAQFNTNDILPFLAQTDRPIQLEQQPIDFLSRVLSHQTNLNPIPLAQVFAVVAEQVS